MASGSKGLKCLNNTLLYAIWGWVHVKLCSILCVHQGTHENPRGFELYKQEKAGACSDCRKLSEGESQGTFVGTFTKHKTDEVAESEVKAEGGQGK